MENGAIVRPTGAAPANRVGALKQFLEARTDTLAQWVRGRLQPSALVRFALLDYSQNEQLQRCTPESIYLALIACAQTGLEPGALKGEAFIVPYGNQAQFQAGWRGLVKLALRSGAVKVIRSHVVYEHDEFEFVQGSEERVVHRPALRDHGPLIATYALAKMDNGEIEVEVMDLENLEKVRKHAARGGRESPAYRDWADQMYRKAAIRRLCKRLPVGEDFALAAKLDELTESGELHEYRRTLNVDAEIGETAPSVQAGGAAPTVPSSGVTVIRPTPRGVEAAKQRMRSRRTSSDLPIEPPAEPTVEPEVDEPSVADEPRREDAP